MHQRAAAKAAWTAAGLYRSHDPKLRDFLKRVETEPGDCWPALADRLRAHAPELLAQLVEPLWKSGDKLLRINVIRFLDPARKDEHDLLDKLARKLDARDDAAELAAIARSSTTAALEHLAKRKDVAEPIRGLARQRLVVLAQEAADQAAEPQAAAPAALIPSPVPPKRGTPARKRRSRRRP